MWRSENSYLHWDLNSDPSVVQPVASRYTDYTIEKLLTILGRRSGNMIERNRSDCKYAEIFTHPVGNISAPSRR
jgi:hypothetical protein